MNLGVLAVWSAGGIGMLVGIRFVHFGFPGVDEGLDMALRLGIEGGTGDGTYGAERC